MFDPTYEFAVIIDDTQPSDREKVAAMGVPDAIAFPSDGRQHVWGVARIRRETHLWVQDAEGGRRAIIVAARHHGQLVDLIAFDPKKPEDWAWRVGDTSILNREWMDRPHFDGSKPTLVPTPLEWLRASCEAMVVLDWSAHADLRHAFGLEEEIVAPPAIGRRLDTILRKPVHLPKFIAPRNHRSAA